MPIFKKYIDKQFRGSTLQIIDLINEIVEDYHSMGFDLTLRQIYYQLVSQGHIPNNERSYKNIGNIVNDGRLAGLISWDSIVDRTRGLSTNPHWSSPSSIIYSAYRSYARDKWALQPIYVEVWVEKDALKGIVGKVCSELDVPFFSCRGYVSQSEMWTAAQRFIKDQGGRYKRVILHLGDHDPSGIDMTRDIQERLTMFGASVDVIRIALSMEQIQEFNPPPNPAKLSDTRASSYISNYGFESWELDALKPEVLTDLIKDNVTQLLDLDLYNRILESEQRETKYLEQVSYNWDKVSDFIDSLE